MFPLVITGLGQVLFPNQSNGDLVTLYGCTVGSSMIAQNFNESVYFFPRAASQSASGVDPDITLQNATAQVPRISNATGISPAILDKFVNDNVQGTFWLFGSPYVDVLQLNVGLIKAYPAIYDRYLPPSLVVGNCSST
jgi:K+-transporting ATPase ATPase C chain